MCPVIHVPFFGTVAFHFPAYALFSFVGLLFFMLFLYFRIKQTQMDFHAFLLMILCMAVGVGTGSKALFVVTKLPEILNDFSLTRTLYIVITSGFVFYGGLLGAILGLYLFCRYQHLPFHTLSQIVAPGFPLLGADRLLFCRVLLWERSRLGNPHGERAGHSPHPDPTL